jgi:DNA-directed RNA polymerase specialized sigma24 family protein
MPAAESVTTWIGQLHQGQESALGKLHQRYWPWLVGLARKRLKGARLHEADEEDVAQEVFVSFYRTFKAGGVPQLTNRQDLLALLSTITACKAINQMQHELGVQKRGGGLLLLPAQSLPGQLAPLGADDYNPPPTNPNRNTPRSPPKNPPTKWIALTACSTLLRFRRTPQCGHLPSRASGKEARSGPRGSGRSDTKWTPSHLLAERQRQRFQPAVHQSSPPAQPVRRDGQP